MEFLKADIGDMQKIINILNRAKIYMGDNDINQWSDEYPNAEIIESDIFNGFSYKVMQDGAMVATTAITSESEEDYEVIDGKWISDYKYIAIHRFCIDVEKRGNGIAEFLMTNIEKFVIERGLKSLRVDTFEKNKFMIKFLEKNNFVRCGIISKGTKIERVAFEKILV